MNNENKPYIVYVKTDDKNRIVCVNSSAFLTDVTGWVEIDSGFGDRYHHAQGNYFDKPIYDDRGICRYKIVTFVYWPEGKILHEFFCNGEEYGIFERTEEEMDADYIAPEPEPADNNEARIAALEAAMAAIEEGIASV